MCAPPLFSSSRQESWPFAVFAGVAVDALYRAALIPSFQRLGRPIPLLLRMQAAVSPHGVPTQPLSFPHPLFRCAWVVSPSKFFFFPPRENLSCHSSMVPSFFLSPPSLTITAAPFFFFSFEQVFCSGLSAPPFFFLSQRRCRHRIMSFFFRRTILSPVSRSGSCTNLFPLFSHEIEIMNQW